MDIDRDIANWVLEFLLRQPLEDRTLDSLLRVLPLPDNNLRLKKLFLLKKLESEASRQPVSESILDLLEQLEVIELQQGSESVPSSMKRAYCAVAVESTVGRTGDEDDCSRCEFFEGLMRVWRERIGAIEARAKKGGLFSEELEIWRDDMEAAVIRDSAWESIKKKREEINAVEAVKDYLREEREQLGPSFLELLTDRVKDDEVSQAILGSGSAHQAPSDSCVEDKDVERRKEQVDPRKKFVGRKQYRLRARNSTGAKIVDSDEMTTEPSSTNHNLQSSKTISGVARVSECEDPAEENHVEPISDDVGVVQATGSRNKPKPSSMQRSSSAQTHEWDDSIDGSQDDPGIYRDKLPLRSPRLINVSPLRKHSSLERRRRRKWTPQEEDTLMRAVQMYGRGNWKYILSLHPEMFHGRTDVDLKDKWRNLTR